MIIFNVYIENSTKFEIKFALEHGKLVNYLEN